MIDELNLPEILSSLNNKDIYNIEILNTVDSTNLYLKNLAKNNAVHNTIIIADNQTSGRGRLGKSFFSPPGSGIYMSILFKADKLALPFSHITVAAGVAVCRVLGTVCNSSPSIKWVNDVFLNGKKVCGILAEGFVSPQDNAHYIIVGTGINVSTATSDFPVDISDIAGSVFPENASRNTIIAKIINEFENIFSCDNIAELIAEYKSYSMLINKEINFSLNSQSLAGTVTDINLDGNLVVALPDSKTIILKSGEVSLGSQNFVH